jgi:hypothetical protein
MSRKVATIDSAPISGGRSAATRLRKTHGESRKRSGKAMSSARARSEETCSPISGPTTSGPPSFTPSPPSFARSRSATSSSSIPSRNAPTTIVWRPSRETNAGLRVSM